MKINQTDLSRTAPAVCQTNKKVAYQKLELPVPYLVQDRVLGGADAPSESSNGYYAS